MNALERLKKQASIEIEKGTLSHEEIMKNLKPFLEKKFKTFFTTQGFSYSSSYSKYDAVTTYEVEYGDIIIQLTVNDYNRALLFRISKDLEAKKPRSGGVINHLHLTPCNFNEITSSNPDNYLFILQFYKESKYHDVPMFSHGVRVEELFIAVCDEPENFGI